jgi:hypothetical protein
LHDFLIDRNLAPLGDAVADELVSGRGTQKADFGTTFTFPHVFKAEIDLINKRRRRDERGAIKLEHEAKDVSGEWIWRPLEEANLIGLALSGGGIRSAAFCLGVLQALHETGVLKRVDYLSTVSGGGYIGCSLTAALETAHEGARPPDNFPFASRLMEDEPPALQHVRNYSNYLFPDGAIDLLYNAAIYARGLVVNAVLVASVVFAGSGLTLGYYTVLDARFWPRAGVWHPFGLQHFFLTLFMAALLVAVGIAWGVARSLPGQAGARDIPGQWTKPVGWLAIGFFIVAFCELQPLILDVMLGAQEHFAVVAARWVKTLAAILAPVGAAMAFLASKLGEYVKSAMQSPTMAGPVKAFAVKAAILVGGLIIPFLIWMVYLDVTYWGICINRPAKTCSASTWLAGSGHGFAATVAFLLAAGILFLVSLLMRPNANSLHPLYRDRLQKAFLFVPKRQLRKDDHLREFDTPLSKITCRNGPYHLINAALNVQASKTANRRGRNADFFVFSPLYCGSKSTEYARTADVEDVAIGFDLATVMAVSGAAVSSNMGAQSIKPLAATLALLNIRLGFWLRNPQRLADARPPASPAEGPRISEFRRRNNLLANYYFVAELFGLLSDQLKSIYLTDGGHIENLGIYELLRRRCRVIIAVDAEADSQMAFGAFNTLERYALIDMGIRIDLPWEKITKQSLATGKAIDDEGDAPKRRGPHCAIGEISYPGDRKGVLVYIKASLTGDENDYVFNYKTRYGAFPHETTLDQWFTEEQFEAYRALGFHAAYRLFDRSDAFAHRDPQQYPDVRPYLALLDRLFPRVESGGPPGQRQTFGDWLAEGEGPRPGSSGIAG